MKNTEFSFQTHHANQNRHLEVFLFSFLVSGEAAFPLWSLGGYKFRPGSRNTFKTLFINCVGYLFRSEWCLDSLLPMLFHIKVAHLSL